MVCTEVPKKNYEVASCVNDCSVCDVMCVPCYISKIRAEHHTRIRVRPYIVRVLDGY